MSDVGQRVVRLKPGHRMELLGLEVPGVGTLDFSDVMASMFVADAQSVQVVVCDPKDTLSGVMYLKDWWSRHMDIPMPRRLDVVEICYQLWVPDETTLVMRAQNYIHKCKHPTWLTTGFSIRTDAPRMFRRESLGFLVDAPKSFNPNIKAIQFIN